MANGWIKLHRKMLENPTFRHDPTAWRVFEVLLIIVNSKTGVWSGGRKQLAELSGLNENTLKSALVRLGKREMVTQTSTTKYTQYHICNWTEYQGSDTQPVTQTSPKRHPNDTTITRNKNKELELFSNKLLNGDPPKKQYGDPTINELFAFWADTMGFGIHSQIKANRQACSTLVKRYQATGVKQLIELVSMAHADQFAGSAGSISNFVQLRDRQGDLNVWIKRKGSTINKGQTYVL